MLFVCHLGLVFVKANLHRASNIHTNDRCLTYSWNTFNKAYSELFVLLSASRRLNARLQGGQNKHLKVHSEACLLFPA